MGRDKSKDDDLFNCSQEWELNYVAGLYSNKEKVYNFLKTYCANGTISHYTHKRVYKLIEEILGYPIPN